MLNPKVMINHIFLKLSLLSMACLFFSACASASSKKCANVPVYDITFSHGNKVIGRMVGIPVPDGASVNVGQKINKPSITFHNLGTRLIVEIFVRDKNGEVNIVTYSDGKNSLQLPVTTVHVLGRKSLKVLDAGESSSFAFSLNNEGKVIFESGESDNSDSYIVGVKQNLTTNQKAVIIQTAKQFKASEF